MKGKTVMTEEWRPSVGCIVKIRQRYPRYDVEYYIEEMRDHFLGNGKPMKDWDATFRNWIRRATQFGKPVMFRPRPVDTQPLAKVHDLGTVTENPLSREEALKKFGR